MQRLAQGLLRHRKLVVAAFLLAALMGAVAQSRVTINYNVLDYLPQNAQSTRALSLMEEEFSTSIPNARVMLHDVSIPEALEYKHQLKAIPGVSDILWLDDLMDVLVPLEIADQNMVELYYKNGAALINLTISAGDEVRITNAIYDIIGSHNAVAGAAVDKATMQNIAGSETSNAMLIIVPLIIVILLFSTTSWLDPLMVLIAIGVSILINMGTNLVLGEVSFVTRSVSPILQLAVSLDYAVFLLHSFDHYRQQSVDAPTAMHMAMTRAFPAIAASAATTLFGFLALVFMRFGIGADLGINLAKGVFFSFVSVMVFLPALIMTLYPWLDKTRHKKLMPDFKSIGTYVYRARIPVLILVLLLLVPSYLAQSRNHFFFGEAGMGEATRSGSDAQAIDAKFGQSTVIVLLVPRGDMAREDLLSQDLQALDAVTQVVSYTELVGVAIPPEFVGDDVIAQFYSPNYARIIVYTDTEDEGERAFAVVEEVQALANTHYAEGVYSTGQSVTLYDMKNVVTRDNITVSRLAAGAIFVVLMLTFRSLSLPIILLITIQTAIWINLATPYFAGDSLSFIGFLIISAVQLGATVDYAILLSSHYTANRQGMSPRQAISQTLSETIGTILVSASILALAGVTLKFTSSNPMVSELGLLLARGTVLSMLMVFFFLPAALSLFDRIVERTTLGITFYKER